MKRGIFRSKLFWITAVELCSLALAPWAPGARASDDANFIATVSNPCTAQESWNYGALVPQAWQDRFSKASAGSKDIDSNLVVFASAKYLSDYSRNDGLKSLGEYQQGRSLYQLGLTYLAYEQLSSVLRHHDPRAAGLRLAALECLERLETKAPSLVFLPATVKELVRDQNELSAMPDADRNELDRMLVSFSEKRIASDIAASTKQGPVVPQDPALDNALTLLQGSGPYEAYVQTLQAANAGKSDDAIQDGQKFLAFGDALPQSLQSRANAVRVLVGQLEYDKGKYTDAAHVFRQVASESNYLSQALTDLGWSHLLNKEYPDAMSAARNLLMGGLKRAFSPEANIVTAIAFLSTCHYPEALKTVKMFQKSYWYTYNWLYRWKKSPADSPYKLLVNYLGKTGKLPVRVASEWARSPIFIESQEELNAIYDERDALTKLGPELRSYKRAHRGLARSLAFLSTRVDREARYNRTRESLLVDTINADLTQRGRAMLANIADVWGNSQLLEVDIYNQLGDKMMADNFSAKHRKIADNEKAHQDNSPTWDWGRVPATDEDTEEVWEDEVGFLQMNLDNRCAKIKN